jgi:rubrerythrin
MMDDQNSNIVTASAIISFSIGLEEQSSSFYKSLAERYPEYQEPFLSFAESGNEHKKMVTRTYQETISDAIEACFSFKDLNLDEYLADMTLDEDTDCFSALKAAIDLEDRSVKFYTGIAKQSQSLLATIPRAFKRVAKMREKRKIKLKALLDNLK